jgi:Glyoxalase-like domain
MAHGFQVVVDARQPHLLADWWADALGWVVERPDEEFIRSMIGQGYATEDETMRHHGALVWRDGAAIRPPEGQDGGMSRRILFQLVPEAKIVKNRLHLDIGVGRGNLEAERERLTASGATFLHTGHQGPHGWVTMADPEGNEFCLQPT